MTEILAANERSFNKSYLKEKSIFQFHFTQQVLRYKPEGRGFDSRCDKWNFSLAWSFRQHYDPGVDSACNRNEYKKYLMGVRAAGL